jgi:Protein of unknown function (DUF732)
MGKSQRPVVDMMRFSGGSHSARVLVALAALAAWVMLAPDAVADTNDDAYLNAMEAHNIHSIGGPGDLIYAGHQVCGFLSPDTSPAMVTDYVVRGSVNGGRVARR